MAGTKNKSRPSEVGGPLRGKRCVQVAAGGKHSLCLEEIGQMWSWGDGGNGRLGLGTDLMGGLLPAKIKKFEDGESMEEEEGDAALKPIEPGDVKLALDDELPPHSRTKTKSGGSYLSHTVQLWA